MTNVPLMLRVIFRLFGNDARFGDYNSRSFHEHAEAISKALIEGQIDTKVITLTNANISLITCSLSTICLTQRMPALIMAAHNAEHCIPRDNK